MWSDTRSLRGEVFREAQSQYGWQKPGQKTTLKAKSSISMTNIKHSSISSLTSINLHINKKVHLEFHSVKLSFKSEREIKTFSEKEKLREFIARRATPKEIFRDKGQKLISTWIKEEQLGMNKGG